MLSFDNSLFVVVNDDDVKDVPARWALLLSTTTVRMKRRRNANIFVSPLPPPPTKESTVSRASTLLLLKPDSVKRWVLFLLLTVC